MMDTWYHAMTHGVISTSQLWLAIGESGSMLKKIKTSAITLFLMQQ